MYTGGFSLFRFSLFHFSNMLIILRLKRRIQRAQYQCKRNSGTGDIAFWKWPIFIRKAKKQVFSKYEIPSPDLWRCIYVSMYLCIYVSMYLCIHKFLNRKLASRIGWKFAGTFLRSSGTKFNSSLPREKSEFSLIAHSNFVVIFRVYEWKSIWTFAICCNRYASFKIHTRHSKFKKIGGNDFVVAIRVRDLVSSAKL